MSRYPLFDPEFLDAIERQVIERWAGFAWRVTVGTTEPFQTNIRGARWNAPGVEALYTSLSRDTAIAEVEHLLSMQPVPVSAPRFVSRLRLELSRVVDLSQRERIEALGWSADDLTGDDWRLPQKIGSAIEFLAIQGVLVPSARADATNLVLFMKQHGIGDSVQLVETVQLVGSD